MYKALWSWGPCRVNVTTRLSLAFPIHMGCPMPRSRINAFFTGSAPQATLHFFALEQRSDFTKNGHPSILKCTLSQHLCADQSQSESELLWEVTAITPHRNALSDGSPSVLYILHMLPTMSLTLDSCTWNEDVMELRSWSLVLAWL